MSSILNKENCTNCVARQQRCFGIQIGVDGSILSNPSHSVYLSGVHTKYKYPNEIIRLRVVAILSIVK